MHERQRGSKLPLRPWVSKSLPWSGRSGANCSIAQLGESASPRLGRPYLSKRVPVFWLSIELSRRLVQLCCASRERARLGVPITGNPQQLEDALQSCSRRYPALRVEARRGYSARHAQALLAGRLDAAVVFGAPEQTSGLSYQRLAVVELQLVCPADSLLAGQDQVNLGQLDGLLLIALDRTLSPALGPTLISEACGSPTAEVETADSLEALLMTVAAGGAVALLPEAVTSTVTWRGVCYRSLGAGGPTVDLGISWAGALPAVVACLLDEANW